MSIHFKHVLQMNGVFVMDALHSFKGPISINTIIKHIGKLRSITPKELKEQIEEVVEIGVQNGFIEKNKDGKYSIAGGTGYLMDEYENIDNEIDINEIIKTNDENKQEENYKVPFGIDKNDIFPTSYNEDYINEQFRNRTHLSRHRSRSKQRRRK